MLREHILSEIRRLTKANNGNPPGQMAFARETGIRRSEWLGRYWARWGDALTEAGFEPNTFQQRADAGSVLHKLAEVVRHYRKLPTHAELRMYAEAHTGFPNHATFSNHFPTQEERVQKLRALALEDASFADVASFLPSETGVVKRRERSVVVEGFVYLIKSGAYYKIGRSDELERRVKEIRVALPDAATLVHSIRTDDPAGIEAYWHRRFAERRANGEWFKLTTSDVAAFKRRKYQ